MAICFGTHRNTGRRAHRSLASSIFGFESRNRRSHHRGNDSRFGSLDKAGRPTATLVPGTTLKGPLYRRTADLLSPMGATRYKARLHRSYSDANEVVVNGRIGSETLSGLGGTCESNLIPPYFLDLDSDFFLDRRWRSREEKEKFQKFCAEHEKAPHALATTALNPLPASLASGRGRGKGI